MEKFNYLERKIEDYISKNKGKIAVAFYDLDSEDGFFIEAEKKMPSASMIKLLIMAKIFEEVKNKSISLDKKIIISEKYICDGSGILKELNLGHSFTIKELTKLMIIASDNVATNILIDLLGMEEINNMGKSLGLKNTSLQRKMMDVRAKSLGKDNFTSAKDISKILKLIYERKLVDEKSSLSMLDILLRQQYTQSLKRFLKEEIKVASKSGDLDCLENDGGIFFLEKINYILVVLVNEASSNYVAKEIIGKISKIIYEEMEN